MHSQCSLNATMLFYWKVLWTTSGLVGAEHWMIISNIKLEGIKKQSDFYSSSWSKYCLLSFSMQILKQCLEKYGIVKNQLFECAVVIANND